jgi:hypothetical protein
MAVVIAVEVPISIDVAAFGGLPIPIMDELSAKVTLLLALRSCCKHGSE